MTVSSIVVRAVAGWTGIETQFPTGIQVQSKSQLIVSLVPDEGARLPLTLGLHYSVNLSPGGVATVVPLAAFPAVHGEVSFVRRTPMTQDYDPTATDTYDAAGHAAALDRSAMRVAELSQKVDDIEAASIVLQDGAASVPAGAVYVSDGEGRAVAGPSASEVEAARTAAVGAAGTANFAAGIATGAAEAASNASTLADQFANMTPDIPVGGGFSARHWATVAQRLADGLNLENYSTTAELNVLLEAKVDRTRRIKVGSGLSIDGVAGSPASVGADLSTDRLIQLSFPGVIAYFALGSPPDGWLECNGAAISRTSYATLFAVIGTGYGAGNGTTTFNLPDLRGEFIRVFDNGRGVDSGRVIGTYQADAAQGHKHMAIDPAGGTAQSFGVSSGTSFYVSAYGSVANASNQTSVPVTDGSNGTPRTAAETRPRNKALMAIIKY